MADEVDPLQALVDSHLTRLQEISNESFNSSKAMCNDTVATTRKQAGYKTAVLDRALIALGIIKPETGEQPNG